MDWDAYTSDPNNTLDVFSFDGIYLSSFSEKGYLLPIPPEKIQEREDLIPFTLAGCTFGGTLYALPQLLCADFLYTRKDDTALSGITDVMTLYDILGDRETQGVTPEENEGLLVDLSDAFFTKTVMYLDALMDEQQNYTDYNELPDTTNLSEKVLALLKIMRRMGGEEQINFKPEDDDEFVRARWFAEGKGRALIAYSEAMSAMGDRVDEVTVRLFSYGTEKNIPLFYTDMVGISSNISEDKKELALELANVLISEEVLTEMSRPENDDDYPQYLLVARKSVYDALSRDYPIYKLLKDIVNHKENHVFRMGAEAKEFILDMEKTLSQCIGQGSTSPN